MAVKNETTSLLTALAKANGHPDPDAFAKLVQDIMAGKELKAEEATDV